ncbi:MAG: response regulator transcription factor [Chloroflexi bacterium]|nr:response regulator transcription factor [Chloroflexota bacterium]
MKRFRILLVDDEERILNFLRSKLKALGYDVLTAANGHEAVEQAHAQDPDLIVLDVRMPKMDGIEALKQLRTFSETPVIILSACGTDADKIKGLTLGADDYLQKPFNPDELVARIEAIRRRLEPARAGKTSDQITVGDVVVDFQRHCVVVRGEEKCLTRIEWLLLSELAHNLGRLMLYEELLTRVWGPEYRHDFQILRTWISRLREKLSIDQDGPQLIRTIPKTGYIMSHPSLAANAVPQETAS